MCVWISKDSLSKFSPIGKYWLSPVWPSPPEIQACPTFRGFFRLVDFDGEMFAQTCSMYLKSFKVMMP